MKRLGIQPSRRRHHGGSGRAATRQALKPEQEHLFVIIGGLVVASRGDSNVQVSRPAGAFTWVKRSGFDAELSTAHITARLGAALKHAT